MDIANSDLTALISNKARIYKSALFYKLINNIHYFI